MSRRLNRVSDMMYVSKALVGLHCLTGCDSVSAFYGKGKKKALSLLLKDNTLCSAFKDLGEQFNITPDMVIALQKFVCKLYGQNDAETVNKARFNMFRLARKSEMAMPPNKDSLTQHIKRANYQAGMFLLPLFKHYSIIILCYFIWYEEWYLKT